MAPKRRSLSLKRMQCHKRTHFNPMGAPAMSTLRTPIVRIENHKSEVLSCEFHPSGKYLLSANRQGQIHLCDINGTFTKMMVLKGHDGAVMETNYSRDGFDIYSCSTDGTVAVWDTFRGYRKAKLEGHTSGVNCVRGPKLGSRIICSGSNDGTVRIWDTRERKCALKLESGADVTATCFSELGDYIFSGGADNDIKIWDIRRKDVLYKLRGHTDTVTGISLSPCGGYLLSHSVDSSLRVWDIRPFITNERGIHCFASNQRSVYNLLRCAWSQDGTMISAGTAESDVYVWDANTGEVLYELPGHKNNINVVAFHPKESITLSASSDNYLFLHEIQ